MGFFGLAHQARSWLPFLWQQIAAIALLFLVFMFSIQRRSVRLSCKAE